jgi:tyrosyl-tRNA synthetase
MLSHLPLDQQMAVLMRGVDFGDPPTEQAMTRELRLRLSQALHDDRPLRVYLGVDPTSSDIHLGHTVPLRKLRQFQDLGHEVIFIIGTFTALIGDPSDKDKARPQRTREQVLADSRTYVEQVWKVLDPQRTQVAYNDRWLAPLTFTELIELASHFTVQQFLARDNFAQRVAKGDPIWLHEFFYGLMQAYDALELRTDVQIGGSEQLFNLMAGRKLMEARGLPPQICLTLPILVGTDGHVRMSKSLGNYIGIDESPEVQYGKVMSLPDEAIASYARLVTRWAPERSEGLLTGMEQGRVHPRDAKMQLAWEIVDSLGASGAADAAQARFRAVHQEREVPPDMPCRRLTQATPLVNLLTETGLAPSKSQARRLITQGGVQLDGERIASVDCLVEPVDAVLQVGKRRFLHLLPG